MKEIESITEGHYRKQIVQYDPDKILVLCNLVSIKLIKDNQTILTGEWFKIVGSIPFKQVFHITQHKIALTVMIALQNYPYSHGKSPTDKDIITLINNVTLIHNPIDNLKVSDPKSALASMMVRLVNQQFPFQEGIINDVPRHLLLYLYSNVKSPSLNLDKEALKYFGLRIKEYITIGVAFYSAALAHPVFERTFIEKTLVVSLKKYLTDERIDRFLAKTSANFLEFRLMCMNEINEYPDGGTYRFNPLFDRPIIRRRDGSFSIPVPMLISYVITKGIYYDFCDIFTTSSGNQFAEWFGHSFENYGGLLLKNTFGKNCVFPEPVYGKEHKRGPDWTVIQNDSAIVFEFRSGRLNKKSKIYGDHKDITNLVNRNIVEPLKKFSEKINDIRYGITGIPSGYDMQFIPCIVTYEPLYLNELFLDIVAEELSKEGISGFDYELMSIEDLELLLAWTKYENMFEFLKTKMLNPEWKIMSVRGLIEKKAKEKNATNLRNPMLDKVAKHYWIDTFPELAEKFKGEHN